MDEPFSDHDEISLLDLLVVLAESWFLLIVVPLLVGLAAFGFTQLQPRSFQSSAVVSMPQAEVTTILTNEFIAAAVGSQTSAPGVSEVMSGLSLSPAPGSAPKTNLSLELPDGSMVRSVLTAIVAELDRTALAGQRSSIEQRLGEVEILLTVQQRTIARLATGLRRLDEQNDFDAGAYATTLSALATLIAVTAQPLDARLALRRDLDQIPFTIVDVPVSSPRMIGLSPARTVLLAVFATGFGLIILVFLRSFWRKAAASSDGSAKIARIRRAFTLRRVPVGPDKE